MTLNNNVTGAMETQSHSKNGRNLKKLIVLFIVICASVGVWGQTFKFNGSGIHEYEFGEIKIDLENYKIECFTCDGGGNYLIKAIEISKDNDITFQVYTKETTQFQFIGIGKDDITLSLRAGSICNFLEHNQENEYKRLLSTIKAKVANNSIPSIINIYDKTTTPPSTPQTQTAPSNSLSAAQLYNLGVKYGDGNGVPKDDNKAFDYFRQAAEKGHAGAQHQLGMCYAWGYGVERNGATALYWFRRALKNEDGSLTDLQKRAAENMIAVLLQ